MIKYNTDDEPREKHHSIELSDKEYMENMIISKPPLIPMKLDMPILEKQIAEKGMHPNETGKNKTTKRKPKRIHSKSN